MDKAEYVFEKLAINITPELAEKLMANRAIRVGVSSILRDTPEWVTVGGRTSRQLKALEAALGASAPTVLKEYNAANYYKPNRGLEAITDANLVDAFYTQVGSPKTSQTSILAQLIGKKYKPEVGTKASDALNRLIAKRPNSDINTKTEALKNLFANGELPNYL